MIHRKKFLLLTLIALTLTILVSVKHYPSEEAMAHVGEEYGHIVGYSGLKDGIYTGEADGFNGVIKVEMTVELGRIANARVLEHHDNENVAKQALENLPKRIVESQSYNVDSVSSATKTSEGIKSAIKSCIRQAGGNPNDF